ncbi:high choriolytic enzyme 1 [Brachyhypopomus gauderio]|uniref:high choriolytic enzyme 1 n=1 Tax=Brachyhypopomus gauderio TaxID=698409 RepID=UPI0040412533
MLWTGVVLGLVMQSWALPLQNSSAVHETKTRSKRRFSEEYLSPDDMNPMDRILRVNGMLAGVRGFSFREGDIASSGVWSAITCPGQSCLWSKSVDGFVYVPYTISPLYDNMDRITIEVGMQDISDGTCVKFVPRTHQANFLDIQPKLGCWSFLGMVGGGQPLSLQSPGCMWSGVASHELMHALGFVHEQSRSDRDRYVRILWENIIEGQKHNFKKYETNNLNTIYDYDSVMHYGRYAFSEDGLPTIIPKPDPDIPIGQRDGPSLLDIHKINLLYNCGGIV